MYGVAVGKTNGYNVPVNYEDVHHRRVQRQRDSENTTRYFQSTATPVWHIRKKDRNDTSRTSRPTTQMVDQTTVEDNSVSSEPKRITLLIWEMMEMSYCKLQIMRCGSISIRLEFYCSRLFSANTIIENYIRFYDDLYEWQLYTLNIIIFLLVINQ